MAVTIQIRRDTAANWTSANPVLHQGEPALETDTGKTKYGDGSTAWTSLAYSALPLAQLDNRYTRAGPAPSGDTSGATDAASLAAASASAGSWTTIELEAGTYYVNATVLTTNAQGVVFRGQGKFGATTVVPVGTGLNGVSIFKFIGCRSSGVENMWIKGNSTSGQVPYAAVEAQANNPITVVSTNLLVRDCWLGATTAGSLTYGIAWTLGYDDNNDEGHIENVDMDNISTSCLYIGHLNSLQHKIIGGTWTVGGSCSLITLAGGSFSCYGTSFIGTAGWIVDMGAGTYTHPCLLAGAQSEGPSQWFRSNSGASGASLYLAACDISGGAASTTVIDWETPAGMFSATSCSMVTGQTGTLAQFTSTTGSAVFSGCTLGISGYTWYNALAFQTCVHLPGTVTMTQHSGAASVYQPNDTGGGFTPFNFFEIYTSTTGATLPGAGTYEITCVGGGGGGSGGGTPSSGIAQAGGAGGACGATVTQHVTVAAATSISVTAGAGGAGGNGGASGANAGLIGTFGASSTVTGSGISVLAAGGSPGRSCPASSTTGALGGTWGTGVLNGEGSGGAVNVTPGCGGSSGVAGSSPLGLAAGGGAGGGPATTTLGGGGGSTTAYGAPDSGAGASGASGTAAGVTGTSAAANSGGGGGGGGGGAYNSGSGGAGGNGGAGGSGFVVIKRVA